MAYYVGYLIGVIIRGIIWGVAAKAVISNKGYYDEGTKWFWLGFFFGLITVIVAATKPVYHRAPDISYESWKKEQDQKLLQNDGWKCTCGRINASYVYSCACGKSKSDVTNHKAQQIIAATTDETKQEATTDETNQEATTDETKQEVTTDETKQEVTTYATTRETVTTIREFKALLDEGIITQEEFDLKKKQLLGL